MAIPALAQRDPLFKTEILPVLYQKNTFPYEGRNESLVGVTPARVLTELFA